jgi:hypothetical protein
METPFVVLPDLGEQMTIVLPNQTPIRPIQTVTGWAMPVTIAPTITILTRKIVIHHRVTALETPVTARVILIVTGILMEVMPQSSNSILAEASLPLPVPPAISAKEILIVMKTVTEPMLQNSKKTSVEAVLTTHALHV